ncbi:acetylglutamate kinase [Leeuwenhoekiella marinoflava]|uniref:Acetylglutamate kinase n=2 Tax=Leeuwenhoekiella marinoflava TaxID=988 RepID=A0A4Q0PQG1_9FLAO|nr:acetylglutamate kinase [Leeuwenhoekiella marinoflava]RXG32744.1 N-acetylglutamate kinase [Leeuwenhoekiella marinoflava]SHE55480.1 N-acetylglutamate kinase [Leeuwenhoekiella marinoflava DSM 3653]
MKTKSVPPSGARGLKLNIVKVGGNIIEKEEDLQNFLDAFAALPEPKILVHGGGKLASQLAERLNIPVNMVNGRRITDAETVEVITMVYGGKVNKSIVAGLQARDCNAIGFSGADGNAILSVKRPVKDIDFGFVGDVVAVDAAMIHNLLSIGITPAFCAITHDGKGQLLNTNADTIACELAIGLSEKYEVTLNYCFEKAGVLLDINNDNSVVKDINSDKYAELLNEKIIADGMLPKMENCFYALKGGVHKVHLGKPEMLHHTNANFTTLRL